MRWFPPRTVYIYLYLPSTQRIRTHKSHRHNTTPPDPGTSHLPTPHLHHLHTAIQTQTYVQHPLCYHMIGKAQTQSSHPLTPSSPTPPRAKHIHISHTPSIPLIPRTTLIYSISAALDTIPEPRVPPTCPALTTTTPHPSPTPSLPSPSHPHTLSAYTHTTQTTVHASQSHQPSHPHRVPRQPHRQTKNYHMTTYTTQGHRQSSKIERNLIILHVNMNGIKNSRSSTCLFTTHVHISSHIRKPSSPLKQIHPKYITSSPCMPIGYTRQGVGSLHLLRQYYIHYN